MGCNWLKKECLSERDLFGAKEIKRNERQYTLHKNILQNRDSPEQLALMA